MQTFLPIATTNYSEIAKVLDNRRLNKQALEGWQILMTLVELDPQGNHRKPKGWVNHPAVKMWRGHELALFKYVVEMVNEWKRRGFKSTIADKAESTIKLAWENALLSESTDPPEWAQDPEQLSAIAATHRQALLVKDYEWYSQFDWPEDSGTQPYSYEYKWPV